ncbi:MAG: VOC family protein [Deltaproteobacteria bacterium]|nr:VOC family protein [Deltaproteobacteria bacterium]
MIRPERIAHVVIKVRDLERSRKFYTEVLGMDVMNYSPEIGILFLDPDGHELELYCDNPPQEYANLPNSYIGMDKLDFAKDDPGLADVFAQMRH